tara:strand:+ start:1347 stop:1628 length:282 start_codon:yes stop_codon:yes gene_type:complete
MEINKVIEKVFKKLKMEKSISKDTKISDKTYLTGTSSPLDSVAFVQFTSYLENEISKKIKKDFFIILNEIPEFKKNNHKLTLGGLKKFLKNKV